MRYSFILVTGGAGFIGSNLAVFLKRSYPHVTVAALDNLKRRGSELNIGRLRRHGVEFIHGDIRCPEDLVHKKKIDLLLECSAEPSVLAGYDGNPSYVIQSNLVGTVHCLELCRRHRADIVFLSTSRVYPYRALNSLPFTEEEMRFEWNIGGINEEFTTTGPKTLYGATKLGSELLIQEYLEQYGLKGVINRCGVVTGPWQFGRVDQGIFALWMIAHYFKRPLEYIGFGGRGKQVRDFIHVDDLCELVRLQINKLHKLSGSLFNVGGGRKNSLSLCEATQLCQKITGNRIPIGSVKQTRYGDVRVYLSDTTKVTEETGWKPKRSPEKTLADIYRWIYAHEKVIRESLNL